MVCLSQFRDSDHAIFNMLTNALELPSQNMKVLLLPGYCLACLVKYDFDNIAVGYVLNR